MQRARWWCWWLSSYPCWDCISRRCSNSWRRYIRPRRSFHCRSRLPCERIGAVGALVVLVAVQLSVLGLYLPPVFKRRQRHIHPRRSFHCRSRLPCDRLGQWARWSCWWLSNYPCWDCISRRCSKWLGAIKSTPDDHFTAGPDCRVMRLGQRARWSCWWLSNYPCWDCISRRCSTGGWRHTPPQTIISLPVQTAV